MLARHLFADGATFAQRLCAIWVFLHHLFAHSVGSPSGPGHAHSLPVTAAMPTAELALQAHDKNELVEMRAMFKEMKALAERNSI